MVFRRDRLIKTINELGKPIDMFNIGFVGNVGSGGGFEVTSSGATVDTTSVSGRTLHKFASNGTLTVTNNDGATDAEIMVVAGGGCSNSWGAAGAGGYVYIPSKQEQ